NRRVSRRRVGCDSTMPIVDNRGRRQSLVAHYSFGHGPAFARPEQIWREHTMAAMKPRTGDGPLEAAKEGRGIVMRVPLEGGGRLVVELTPDEASTLGQELRGVTG